MDGDTPTRLETLTRFLERNGYTSLAEGEVYDALRGVSDLLNTRSQMYLERLGEMVPGSSECDVMAKAAEMAAAQFLAYEELIYIFMRLVELAETIETEETVYEVEDESDGGPN